ncbi:MAG TPA: serine/threonine-protein kinase [Pedobacter sp.]
MFKITKDLENMGALRTSGHGSVYKGKRIDGTLVAVKVLPASIDSENDDNLRNFQDEVQKLNKINDEPNPHVVKILNSGITESGSLPFIEMEFIEAPDLEELLNQTQGPLFSVSEVIKVAEQLSNALAHCHKARVKHGDVKSTNVKLDAKSGKYILVGFGLPLLSDEHRRNRLSSSGAIEYMAPEQNTGQMLFQTDIYSFGIILFKLLACEVPFPLSDNGEASRDTVMMAHLGTPVPNVVPLRKSCLPASWPYDKKQSEIQVPEWLLEIVYKCLEKKPEHRYKDGVELHEAIVYHATHAVKVDVKDTQGFLVSPTEVKHSNTPVMKSQQAPRTTPRPASSREPQHGKDLYDKRANSGISISKPVFFTLIALLAGVVALAAYSFLNKEPQSEEAATLPIEGLALADSAGLSPEDYSISGAAVPIDTAALNAENQRLRDSISLLQKLNARRVQDSVKQAKKYAVLKQKLAKAVRNKRQTIVYKEEKKRKKGFLGIRIGKRE